MREPNGRWLKGQSANPAGRPQSSRQRIAETLLKDLQEVWEEHGKTVLTKLAVSDPGKLAQIAYGLLPRDIFVKVEDQRAPGGLDADSYAALRRLLDIIQASGVDGDPQAVFERIEAALQADAATVIESVEK